jgi:N-dimethylarginine dimethylaminohydrolase
MAADAFPAGLPRALRGWEVIEVPKALAKSHMAVNNLVIDDRTLVLPSEAALDPLADTLAARGFQIHRIPYRVPCMVGGSFRCAHQPLIRG